ncbi:MAG: phosphoribosylanthranilate isomerase [Actinomycetia bacterium]|nr:phosphoribosylanthranilate isomerase [Actinomycetes bacterium]
MFVKICGVTTEEDALLSVALGADALGFNFSATSKRQVRPGAARDIIRRLPPEILTVAVFRDQAREHVLEVVNTTRVRAVQLHGHETPEYAQWVHQRVPVLIPAFAAGDPGLDQLAEYGADAVLIDSPTPGSGEIFDWRVLERAPVAHRRLILAGGLNSENVADAIGAVRPWGVDVASGVESAPGRKDPVKLRAFIEAAKAALPDDSGPNEQDPAADSGSDPTPFDWQEDPSLWR